MCSKSWWRCSEGQPRRNLAVDEVPSAAGRMLAASSGEHFVAARIHDNAFVILVADADEDSLDALGGRLPDRLMKHSFEIGGKAIRLRASVGICQVHFESGDASALVNAAERACREAVVEVDRWVVTRAMSAVRQRREDVRAVRLLVPQAMATITAADQAAWLKAALASHDLTGSELVLECRLDEALLNPTALGAFANAMRDSGVQMCIGQYEHNDTANRLLDETPLAYIKLASKTRRSPQPCGWAGSITSRAIWCRVRPARSISISAPRCSDA